MRKLNFKKLWIVSDQEKSARVESLDSSELVVTSQGLNRTGKSSFIKSIYAALGADPKKNNASWESLETKLLLEFAIDGKSYFSLRVGNNIAFFDSTKNLISVNYGITKSADTWGKLLKAPVKFPSHHGNLISAMPAAIFMPFYIDQDTGLNETWDSFDGLGAYKSYKDTIIDFHTGIRPKEYYQSKAQKEAANKIRKELELERQHLQFAQNKLEAHTLDTDMGFDATAFEHEVGKYLEKQTQFNEIRERVRMDIRDLQGRRNQLLQEKKLALSTLTELEADITYLKKLDTSELVCPTCNAKHEASFANTLRLTGDAETCRLYLSSTIHELEKISVRIEKKTQSLRVHEAQIADINNILGEKRGALTLRNMLEHESRRIAGRSLDVEKNKIDIKIGGVDEDIRDAESDMKKHSSRGRKSEILDFYQTKLRAFCNDLNIPSPPENMFLKIRPVVNDTGSDLPRLILAYQYAVLHTISEYSSAVTAPIVFDTAQHQDQDDTNINAIIKFAFEKRPAGSQFIFGTVSLHDYSYSGDIILANTKRNLLKKDSYVTARAEMEPFVEALFANQFDQPSRSAKQELRKRTSSTFISYSRSIATNLVDDITRALVAEGVNVTTDRSISAGRNVYSEIESLMANATSAILLISKNYFESEWSKNEIRYLMERRRKREIELYIILVDFSEESLFQKAPVLYDLERFSTTSEGFSDNILKLASEIKSTIIN